MITYLNQPLLLTRLSPTRFFLTIISFRDFYLGIDKQSFFDLQLHLGIFRLEWGSTTPKDREPDPDASNRCTDGKDPTCL